MDRRTSRPWQRSDTDESPETREPVVLPALVEHLEVRFPVTPERLEEKSLDGAVNLALRQAEEQGRQQVIAYIRSLVKNPNEDAAANVSA